MEPATVQQPPHAATAWSTRTVTGLSLRCLVTALFLTLGFFGLAYLRFSDRMIGESRILTTEDTFPAAWQLALGCVYALFCITLVVECQVRLLLSSHWPWRLCQWAVPLASAAFGAFFAWLLFRQQIHGPKETMLVAGGGLVLYLGSTFQLAWMQNSTGHPSAETPIPAFWYIPLLLLTVTFLGGLRGWGDASPQIKAILEYRQKQWQREDLPAAPIQPVPPRELPPGWG